MHQLYKVDFPFDLKGHFDYPLGKSTNYFPLKNIKYLLFEYKMQFFANFVFLAEMQPYLKAPIRLVFNDFYKSCFLISPIAPRVVVQSAGYPILSVENEELQGLGRAVQLRNKKTREVTFLLNFAAMASFALHFEKAVGPVSAQLWRAEDDGSTTLYDYDCVKK